MNAIPSTLPAHETETQATPRSARMRAILQSGYGARDVLRFGDAERPQPGAGEVLVQVHAAGLDRGTWHLMTGRPYLMRIMGFGFSRPKNPVPGLDLSGTVVALGSGVSRFRVGDAVFGLGRGSFAEYACAREDKLAHKPDNLGFREAAVLGVSGLTAIQSLDAGRAQRGERVLIVGASGGVGSYAVQLAKALGCEVTAVCSKRKLAAVRALGADHVIDYGVGDFADGSKQYDLLLDIGGNTKVARLRRALTATGRLVFVGNEYGGDWTAGFERQLGALMIAPFVRQRFVMLAAREHYADLERLAALAEQGLIAPRIDRAYPLTAVPEAMRALEAGEICGKAVITLV